MSIVHTEFIDPQGLRVIRQILNGIDPSSISRTEQKRREFLLEYLDAIDAAYGIEIVGPLGLPARSLACTYTRVRSGRLHCHMRVGPKWSETENSYICAQGMPNVLRPYLMHNWGHDLDIENCHVVLMYQLGRDYHDWPEHGQRMIPPLSLHMMRQLYENREDFIQHVADFHSFDTDDANYPGYRKNLVKPLLLRILYGGSYDAWLNEHNLFLGHKSPRVLRLERELGILRDAVLSSKRFHWLVNSEREAQRRRGRSREAADRGIFSKIAQYLECEVLLAMRQHLMNKGWCVHSLIFDGLIVEHRPDVDLNLTAIERYIEHETQFSVRIVEKPLYLHTPSSQRILQY